MESAARLPRMYGLAVGEVAFTGSALRTDVLMPSRLCSPLRRGRHPESGTWRVTLPVRTSADVRFPADAWYLCSAPRRGYQRMWATVASSCCFCRGCG